MYVWAWVVALKLGRARNLSKRANYYFPGIHIKWKLVCVHALATMVKLFL